MTHDDNGTINHQPTSHSEGPQFDVETFVGADVVSRHKFVDEDLRNRLLDYVAQVQEHTVHSKQNPFVWADIGCGNGDYTNAILDDLPIEHIHKYLVDPFGNKALGIHTFYEDAMCNNFPSNHCDVIVCKGVAHLFGNVAKFDEFLRGCERILKPGGALFILLMSADIRFPWGPYAQMTFDISCNSGAHYWEQQKKGAPNCNVSHFNFSQHIMVSKEEWLRFIRERAWSTLQCLSGAAMDETLVRVSQRFKDEAKVTLEHKWTLSVVIKNGGHTQKASGFNMKEYREKYEEYDKIRIRSKL